MERKTSWTEPDLLNYTGVHESLRLDFKESRLMDLSDSKIAETLSKEVSAFANTEGGLIIIGIKERRDGKTRIAEGLDAGMDPNRMSPEQFQQLVEGNVSPYVRGIRFYRVKLSGEHVGRIAIVIDVPAGTTAYQANDKRYYGRSEYESVPLPDHEIRMLMARGRVASATVSVTDRSIRSADRIWEARVKQYEIQKQQAEQQIRPSGQSAREVKSPDRPTFDEWTFHLTVTNTGDVTIRDLLLVVRIETSLSLHSHGRPLECVEKARFQSGGLTGERVFPEAKLFPGEMDKFPNRPWTLQVPLGADLTAIIPNINWTIYLDDSPPSTGVIKLLDEFEKA
jgi:hypothetical protein